MKLITTACAIVMLGPKFEFKTELYRRGELSDSGILYGDIIVRGGGDPNISGRFHKGDTIAVLKSWAAILRRKGIKRVKGDIIGDDRYFDHEYIAPGWPRDQLSNWYCAEICGLSFNDNCVDLTVSPGNRVGATVKFSMKPSTNYVRIINRGRTVPGSSADSISFNRFLGTNTIKISGGLGIKHDAIETSVTIHNPALYFVTVFKETLESQGIPCDGRARLIKSGEVGQRDKWNKLLVATAPLDKTIAVTNKRSQNFYAEQILKTMGAEIKSDPSFSGGSSVIKDFLLGLGYNANSFEIADGSGLSRENRLSPKLITDLLRFMYNHQYHDVFLSSLAQSGIDGTMHKRLEDKPYKSRVIAKTGHIRGVCTLSGYVKTLRGEILAFSILINSSKISYKRARDVQDSICKLLVEF